MLGLGELPRILLNLLWIQIGTKSKSCIVCFFIYFRIEVKHSKTIPKESEYTLLHLLMLHKSLWQGIGPEQLGRQLQTFRIIPLLRGHVLGVVHTMDHEVVPGP